MAGSLRITPPMRIAVVQGAINSFGNFNEQYLRVYNLLLNMDSVCKLRPFNFLKSRSEISVDATLFIKWLQTFIEDTSEDTDASIASCKKVARAISKMAELYGSLLPYSVNGKDSFEILFRVFFLSEANLLSLDLDTNAAIKNIKSLLQLIVWLEMVSVSSMRENTAENYLAIMLEYAGAGMLDFVSGNTNALEVTADGK